MSSISQNRSALKDFLSSISTIKGDLSNITAPPFVLGPRSTVELPASWAARPWSLISIAKEEDAQKRALGVLKWYLSSLKGQQYPGGSEEEGVKKPLNAFLGELFICSFEDDAGTTNLVSEQVSHHPPVTACYLWNEKHGVRAEGYTAQEITLSKTFTVRINQVGHAMVHVDKYNESYLVTLPALSVKGLLTGTPYPELIGTSYISSSAGFTAKIDYSGKGLFSGSKNSFHASLYRSENPEEVLYTAEGQWNDKFTFHSVLEGKEIETYDTNADKAAPMITREKQDPWESRQAWHGVISAIERGDMKGIAEEKSKIEQGQRDMRKKEESEGKTWQRVFFSRYDSDPLFEKLVKGISDHEALSIDKTDGVWKFDTEKANKLEPPYHEGIHPNNS